MNKFPDIQSVFEAFNNLKVVVIGDVMVDAYLWGKVDRISPEAPVPIVAVQKRENRLGGAANVALNIRSMGASAILCSVIGDDRNGEELLMLMKEIGMTTQGMVSSTERVTTVKTRVIGNNHQLLRVDDEVITELSENDRTALTERILSILETENPDVVIFEDYDKGVLGEIIIQSIVNACIKKGIPTAVDPKKKNFTAYKNVNLFKPNLHELKTGLKIDFDKPNADILEELTRKFRIDQGIETLMVTLSESGVFYAQDKSHEVIPAHVRNISDVSGAGDTVISVASLCLALGLPTRTMSGLANLAGGLVCEKIGVVSIDKQQLLEEAEKTEYDGTPSTL
ncbi:D-glycero-beta-D-manno-heptose-7-phosphate kinase [soil metagenome]